MKRYKNLILEEEESRKNILLTNFFIKEFEGKTSNIEGIEKIFSEINRVESPIERVDRMTDLENLEVSFNEENQLVLLFKDEGIKGVSKGKFNSLFLDLFKLSGHIGFLLKKGKRSLAIERISETLKEFKNDEHLFRMIYNKDEKIHNLRSVASKRYMKYDNQFCLYLLLTNLESFILEKEPYYFVDKIKYEESSFVLSLKEKKEYEIDGFKVCFAIVARNSEIKDKTFRMDLKYTITDKTGKSFSGISGLLLNIRHDGELDTAIKNIRKLNKINIKKEATLNFISQLITLDEISTYALEGICNELLKSRDFSDKKIREKITNFRDDPILEGHYKIVTGLNKLQKLAESYLIDDKIIFESIIHKELVKILTKKRK